MFGPTYSQNLKDLDGYYAALDGGHMPVAGGIVLTQDDLVRRAVIQVLACQFRLSIESIVVTPKGRLLVRIVCMAFDRYLRAGRQPASYSKVM